MTQELYGSLSRFLSRSIEGRAKLPIIAWAGSMIPKVDLDISHINHFNIAFSIRLRFMKG